MVVDLRLTLERIFPDIAESVERVGIHFTLEEENLFGFLVRQLFFITAAKVVMFTPVFFLLLNEFCSIFPPLLVPLILLVLLYTLHEAGVANFEAITNLITRITVLLFFGID